MRSKRLIAACVPLLTGGAILVAGCSSGAQSGQSGHSGSSASSAILQMGGEGEATIYTRNFNPFSPNSDLGTTTAIYEPLVVYTPTNGKYTPWLATSWTWGPNSTSLTFNLRHGVKWSDGKPFTAADVTDTFQILKKYFGGGGFPYVSSVVAVSPYVVKFSFSQPTSPALGQVGQQVIAPQHIWSKIASPAKYTNPNPVGTGPFTQITSFAPQSYVLGKNPQYWQPGKPYFAGIRYPAYSTQSENEAIVQGTVDWADAYIPNVQKTYIDKNPKDFHYWFAKTGGTIPLVLNTTMAPFNDVTVRKAISMAINREANVESVYGSYTAIGNSTGLSPTSSFFDPAVAKADDWTTQNVAKANAMLTAAGYKMGSNGVRLTPSGKPMSYTLETGSTSSDYVQSAQNVAADVKKIGINLMVTPKAWNTVISDVELGHFQIAHMFEQLGTTPFTFYDFYMGCSNIVPIGKLALQNFGRYCDPKATKLLAQFAAANTPSAQQQIADALQTEFARVAPVIPLFTQPDWGEFNTARFTGFPSASNPYATGQTRYPGAVIVLTTVKPVG
ncbi:MAG TPA: ABC transporter substrate-binding protein [Streptosporangiaceae bacterium]|nr:ABC transporter substrate-binding protein [Streptosporangiaceae bacterium]